MSASSRPPTRSSYIAGAFLKRENQLAAVITIALAAIVAGLGQVPLQGDFEIDLRSVPPLQSPRYASLVGFEAAGPGGRMTDAARAQIVLNRPLPARFLLEIEGRSVGDPARETVEVQVGQTRQMLAFTAESRIHSFHVDNPFRGRTISLRGNAPLHLALSRVAVR